MSNLVFEKVGDINSKYAYVCVYSENKNDPFMEIAVSDSKEIVFTLYQNSFPVSLTIQQWNEIYNFSLDFLPKALKNAEDD
ncbi:hypothetical protein WJT86_11995 [Microvirga sp. W0021]|uniref:Uncharacterized protein n=1 Tax=Hohaiivirga grylli TaxID=3133970 RepID=A0ABV0BNN1_9HYPH